MRWMQYAALCLVAVLGACDPSPPYLGVVCRADEALCCAGGVACDASAKDYICRPATECALKGEPPCMETADCKPIDPWCGAVECIEHACKRVNPWPTDKPISSQVDGDCATLFCDAAGHIISVEDPDDVFHDGNPCTVATCENGVPVNAPVAEGSMCKDSPGVCNLDMVTERAECFECIFDQDCKGGAVCDGGRCVDESCNDLVKDFDETDYDCGGSCVPCFPGQACDGDADCLSGNCVEKVCQEASATDKVKNGTETGVDCGGPNAVDACPDGQGCAAHSDCTSGVCYDGICQKPTCYDGTKNGKEEGIDCGGKCAHDC